MPIKLMGLLCPAGTPCNANAKKSGMHKMLNTIPMQAPRKPLFTLPEGIMAVVVVRFYLPVPDISIAL
jgi:hypothetical protein